MEFHNDTQFYEQHEFCNYLGLTELATANAVANAMRELANSNVARRSLRVRTQQQLDRMRSDVRGKRRERQQQQQQQQQEQQRVQQQQNEQHDQQHDLLEEQQRQQHHENLNQQLISDNSSTISNNAITISTKKTGLSGNLMPPATNNSFIYPRPSVVADAPVEYYYHPHQSDDQQQPQNTSGLAPSDYHSMTLEAAFAKVYASAAPAQKELHECMQNRLRQARETKPSIYIVKSLNNATPSPSPPAKPAARISTTPSPERLQQKRKPDLPPEARPSRKMLKKMEKTAKRRRTTGGGTTATTPNERDLVTRSTTHLNSKLLRNRKVSLLKSYELTDVAANGRGKRLAGGSAPAAKPTKSPKKKVKKTPPPPEQVVITYGTSTSNRPEQSSPPTPKKPRLPVVEPNVVVRRRRFRTKSLPSARSKEEPPKEAENTDVGPNVPELKAKPQLQQPPNLQMDIHDFITNNSMVSPPMYSAAVRHYVNAVCQPKDMAQTEPQQQQQQQSPKPQRQPDGFFDVTSSFAQLSKPSLNYPPATPPSIQRTPHFSRRCRQVAGTAQNANALQMQNVHPTQPGCLLSLTKGLTELQNPLAGKNGKVLYIYYELDQLIVVQEKLVSFWKYSKIFNVLQKDEGHDPAHPQHGLDVFSSNTNEKTRKLSADSEKSTDSLTQRWIPLGGTRRLTNGKQCLQLSFLTYSYYCIFSLDIEIPAPFDNRLCTHNSTPVYIEMRSHPLDHHKRESNLLSLYVNVYYYCDEELRPKMHSVHLDAVNW